MRADRQRAGERFRDQQGHTRVAFLAVPVAPVVVDVAQLERQLIQRGFDFLQADEVGLFGGEPVEQLALPRANAVDVPGSDLHWLSRRGGSANADQ
jgi:hypothetical protein